MTDNYTVNILLTDDDEDDREFFSNSVKKSQVQINLVSFENGERLLDYLSLSPHPKPDGLLLDINMPRINGFECLKRIRESEAWKNLPIAMYTTSKSEDDINLAFSLGANRYICKPHHLKMLSDIVDYVSNPNQWATVPKSVSEFVYRGK